MLHLDKISYEVPKFEDTILIDTKNWVQQGLLEVCRISGRPIPTYIAKVLKVNIKNEAFKNVVNEGDLVLLTRVASDVAPYMSFSFEADEEKRYFSVPIMQIVGVFRDNVISLDKLTLLFDKYLAEKVELNTGGVLVGPESNATIGRIVKCGTNTFSNDWSRKDLQCSTGESVLIKDNVTTEIMLDGKTYVAMDESAIVCKLGPDYSLEGAKFINESILMRPYIAEKVLNSNLLETPELNYEDEDLTDIFNRDLFKVFFIDENLNNVKKNDIVLANRNLTNYVYYDTVKYFMLNGEHDISGKIKE